MGCVDIVTPRDLVAQPGAHEPSAPCPCSVNAFQASSVAHAPHVVRVDLCVHFPFRLALIFGNDVFGTYRDPITLELL